MFLWMMPMPPSCAMRDRQAGLGHRIHGGGHQRDVEGMPRVRRVLRRHFVGHHREYPGSSRTSSKVRASWAMRMIRFRPAEKRAIIGRGQGHREQALDIPACARCARRQVPRCPRPYVVTLPLSPVPCTLCRMAPTSRDVLTVTQLNPEARASWKASFRCLGGGRVVAIWPGRPGTGISLSRTSRRRCAAPCSRSAITAALQTGEWHAGAGARARVAVRGARRVPADRRSSGRGRRRRPAARVRPTQSQAGAEGLFDVRAQKAAAGAPLASASSPLPPALRFTTS